MPQPPKPIPAHKGARFDVRGRCLAHPDVRLCRPTAAGQYKIVRKACFKCGSAAFMADHDKKIAPHGYKKKKVAPREVPGELLTAGGRGAEEHRFNHRGGREQRAHRHDERGHRHHPHRHEKHGRRARTLSPRRPSSDARSGPRTRLATSHVLRKMSGDALQALLSLKPPFSISKGGDDRVYAAPHEIDPDVNLIPTVASDRLHEARPSPLCKMSEGLGLCRRHPEVKLAIRRTERGDGTWNISRDECPLCAAEQSLCKAGNHVSGHAVAWDAMPMSPKRSKSSPTSPRTVISDEYFARALVLYDPDATASDLHPSDERAEKAKEAYKMEKREKTGKVGGALRRSLLPHSTARMAKVEGKRRGRSCPRRRARAVDAWDMLPVC